MKLHHQFESDNIFYPYLFNCAEEYSPPASTQGADPCPEHHMLVQEPCHLTGSNEDVLRFWT